MFRPEHILEFYFLQHCATRNGATYERLIQTRVFDEQI